MLILCYIPPPPGAGGLIAAAAWADRDKGETGEARRPVPATEAVLLLEQELGQHHPETEQTYEGSTGDKDFHNASRSCVLVYVSHSAGQVLQRNIIDVNFV